MLVFMKQKSHSAVLCSPSGNGAVHVLGGTYVFVGMVSRSLSERQSKPKSAKRYKLAEPLRGEGLARRTL